MTILARTPNVVFAQVVLPQGGQVVSGHAGISGSGASLVVDQASRRAVVDWDSFSVGQGGKVTFNQPDKSSAILNRVTGATPSSIAGQINANGKVFLVNPNGIAITPSGTVQTGGGFVGSSLDIANSDFMAGRLRFKGQGASAAVDNQGTIETGPGGMVGLIGGRVSNTGTIMAPLGKVGIGAGERVTIDPSGDGFLQVAVPSSATTSDGRPLVDVAGRVRAAGGRVEIKAATARQAVHDVVRISGSLSARSISGHSGSIVLDGGPGGQVEVSGRMSAAGGKRAEGGTLVATGRAVRLGPKAKLYAGGSNGGAVLVGGDMRGGRDPAAKILTNQTRDALRTTIAPGASIEADGTRGTGGKVVVWSDQETRFRGTISETGSEAGDGGTAEVSSHDHLDFTGAVDLKSSAGKTGTLLLDPYDVTISNSADNNFTYGSGTFSPTGNSSNLSVSTLQTLLAVTNVTLTTGSSGSQNGDITVANAVTWASGNGLTLTAARDIIVNAGISATNGGGLVLSAGRNLAINSDLTGSGAAFPVAMTAVGALSITNATIRTNGGNLATSSATLGLTNAAIDVGAGTGSMATSATGGVTALSIAGSLTTAGTVGISGTSDSGTGFALGGGVTIAISSGNLTIAGFSTSGTGMRLTGSNVVSNTGSGTIALGGQSSSAVGTLLDANSSLTTSGTASILGISSSSNGIYFSGGNAVTASSGNLSFSGTSTSSGGIWFNGGATLSNGGAGTLSMTGVGNAGFGLGLNTGASVTTTGSVSLSGSSSGGNGLVLLGSNSLTQNSGALTLSGSTGATVGAVYAPNIYGVYFGSSVSVSVASGSFSAVGTATQNAAGLYASGDLVLTNSGAGNLTLGGSSTANGFSVALAGGTLTSTGIVGISSTTSRLVFINSPTVTVASGSLTISGSNSDGVAAGISNKGAVTLNNTNGGSLTLDGTSTSNSGMEMQNGTSLTVNGTVTINVTATSGTGFNALGGNTITLGSGTLTINATSTSGFGVSFAGSSTLTNSGSGSLTIAGSSASNFGLLVGSSASLTTSGTAALSGTTTGSGPQALYLADSSAVTDTAGQLTLTGSSVAGTGLWINNASTLTNSGSGTMMVSGSGTGSSYSVAGIWFNSGATTLTNSGSGSLIVSGTGSGNGTSSPTAGAGLWCNGGTTAFVNSGSGTLSVSGSATASNGIGIQTSTTVTTSGSVALSGTATGGTGFNLLSQLTDTGGALTVTGTSGTGSGVSITGTSGVTVSSGTLSLAGTSTSATGVAMTGTTTLADSGTSLTIAGSSGAAGSSAVSIASGDTTTISGAVRIQESGGSSATTAISLAGAVTDSGALTISSTHAAEVDGIVSGTGSLATTGAGTTTLTAVNTYTGTTTIGPGTLAITASGSLGSGTYAGNIVDNGTLQYSTSAAQTLSGVISGTGALVKDTSSSSTLTLSGANTYTGATTINAGTLQIGNGGTSGALGSGSVVDNASLVFNLSGNTTIANPISGTGTLNGIFGGSLALNGAVALTGAAGVTLNAGSMTLNAALSAPSVRLTAGAGGVSEGGSGSVSATTLSAQSGGAIALGATGNAIGTLAGTSTSGNVALTDSGALTIGTLNGIAGVTAAGTVTLVTTGDLTIASGAPVSGASPALAAGGAFVNNAGSGAVTATSGRWLVYSSTPGADTFGSLDSGQSAIWNATYAGSPPGSVTGSGNRYLFASQPTLTVTSTSTSKFYGVDATASVAGSFSVSGYQAGVANAFLGDTAATAYSGAPAITSAGSATSATVAGGPYTISAAAGSLSSAAGYALSFASSGTLTVNPASVIVTALGGSSFYGASPSNPGLSATGLQNGETVASLTGLSNSFGIANTTNAGNYTLSVAGTLTNGNYTVGSMHTGTWTVNPASVSVTALSGSSFYGASPSNPGLSATGLQNGDTVTALTGLSNSFGIDNTTNAGSYTLSVGGTLTNGNYTVGSTHIGTWTVNPASVIVTALGGSSYYGASPSNPGLSATGLQNGDTAAVLTGLSNSFGIANTTTAGSYTLSVAGTLTNGNYTVGSTQTGTWTVNPASVIVTAIGGSSFYGASPSNPGLSATGLQNGDTAAVLTGLSNSFGIANTTNAGNYTLSVAGTLTNGNYTVGSTHTGTWTVNPASVSVTALGGSSFYGASPSNPGLSATGLQNGDTVASLTGLSNSFGIANTTNAGNYTLSVAGTLTNGNYTVGSTHTGTWTVNPASVSVTALGGSSYYGASPSNPGLSATGLQNGETVASLTGLSNSFGIANTTNAGSYTLSVGGTLTNGNYTVGSTHAGTWTVNPASVSVTALGGSSFYGASPSNPGLSAIGLQNGDTATALTGLSNSFGIANTTTAGSYTLSVGGTLTNGNYTVGSTHTGTWTVNPASVSVTAIGGSSFYGASPSNPGLSATGLQNGETVTSLTGLSNSFGIASNTNAGGYTLSVAGTLTNGNYIVGSTHTGTWTVSPASIVVTALGGSSFYGASPSNPGLSATGLQNGDTVASLTGLSNGFGISNSTNAGGYTLSVGGTLTNGNYTVGSTHTGTWTVNPAPVSVTALGGFSTYGYTPSNPGLSATGLQNGDTVAALTGLSNSFGITNITAAGTYALTVAGALTNGNYTIGSTHAGSWTVNASAILVTVSALGGSSLYGSSPSNPGLSAIGLQNGDTVAALTGLSDSFAITDTTHAGTYTLKVVGALTNTNYTIGGTTDGTWTVQPTPVVLTALGGSSTYGSSPGNPGFSATGLRNGQSVTALTGLSNAFGISAATDAGQYTLGVTGTLTNGDYSIGSIRVGTWTVAPATVDVTALGGSSVYGGSPPNPGLSATGLRNGQTVAALTGLSNSFGIADTTDAGRYTLSVAGTLTNGNYVLGGADTGVWTVSPAPVSVTALGGSSVYGASSSNPGLSATGLRNGDTVASLTGLGNSFGISKATHAGRYALDITGSLTNNNYVMDAAHGGFWTVKPAKVVVTALGGSSPYGTLPSNPGLSATGLQNGDTVASLTGLRNAFGILGTTPVGTYLLGVAGVLTNGDYEVTATRSGSWTVVSSPANIKASLASLPVPYMSTTSPMTISFSSPVCPSGKVDNFGGFSAVAISMAGCDLK